MLLGQRPVAVSLGGLTLLGAGSAVLLGPGTTFALAFVVAAVVPFADG